MPFKGFLAVPFVVILLRHCLFHTQTPTPLKKGVLSLFIFDFFLYVIVGLYRIAVIGLRAIPDSDIGVGTNCVIYN